jgi:hypothetical protein
MTAFMQVYWLGRIAAKMWYLIMLKLFKEAVIALIVAGFKLTAGNKALTNAPLLTRLTLFVAVFSYQFRFMDRGVACIRVRLHALEQAADSECGSAVPDCCRHTLQSSYCALTPKYKKILKKFIKNDKHNIAVAVPPLGPGHSPLRWAR